MPGEHKGVRETLTGEALVDSVTTKVMAAINANKGETLVYGGGKAVRDLNSLKGEGLAEDSSEKLAKEAVFKREVQTIVATLPDEVLQKLDNDEKVNTRGAKELGKDICRSMASGKNLEDAAKSFKMVNESQYVVGGVRLTDDIAGLLKPDKSKMIDKLNINLTVGVLEVMQLDKKDVQNKDTISAIAAGIIRGVASKAGFRSNPFATDVNKANGALPTNVVVAAYNAAVTLSKDDKFKKLTPEEAMIKGKEIGKKERGFLHANKHLSSGLAEHIVGTALGTHASKVKGEVKGGPSIAG